MQSRRNFLASMGSGIAALAAVPVKAATKTNIVLMMTDDLGYECLACNGGTSYSTPHLDRLAASGIRFEHCYSQPLCTPSRVKLMTGRHNFRNYKRFAHLEPEEITFANVLRDAGYATGIVGKWQLGYDASLPQHFGFDEYCLWQLTQQKNKGERYTHPLIEENGEFLPRGEKAYGPAVFNDYARDFMTRHKDEPFFLYYPMVLTHDPFVPSPDSEEWADTPHKKDNKFFADMVAYMDKAVGQVAAHLDELGIRENTLLMFTSDNGTHRSLTSRMGDTVIRGGKGTPPDAGTRVPLIASWPAHIKEGRVSQDLIEFSDFFPTILEAAGAPLPEDREIDGVSFLPQLRGETGNPREWIYIHYDPHWGSFSKVKSKFARNQRYKLYHDGRFYDVPNDPLEERPLDLEAAGPKARAVRKKLQAVIDKMEKRGSVFRPDLDLD